MTVRILVGDCRERLAELPDGSVSMCCTSPPYFGLRDYSTGQWEGGDPACDHKAPPKHVKTATTTLGRIPGYRDNLPDDNAYYVASHSQYRDRCGKCGAVRIDRQIGLEGSLSDYIAALVAVFRDVRRVLRPDGTCWIVLGDSYAGGGRGGHSSGLDGTPPQGNGNAYPASSLPVGLKPKDLMGVPWRVAIALQADGWWLRSDIIWAKTSCMPESVSDRPTSAHEHVFLLSKSPRYFYDQEAVREPWADDRRGAPGGKRPAERNRGGRTDGFTTQPGTWTAPEGREGRNLRNVWQLGPDPFPGAHFAVYPRELARRCIKAGTSEKGVCAACGAPWVRLVERIDQGWDGAKYGERVVAAANGAKTGGTARSTLGSNNGKLTGKHETTGWSPSCTCKDAGDPIAATVLDIFAGAGTTGLVADQLGRDAILIELNPEYAAMSEARIRNDAPMFADVALEAV